MSTLSTLEVSSLKGALEALLLVSKRPGERAPLAGALDIAPASARRCSPSSRLSTREANRGFQLRGSPAAGACLRTRLPRRGRGPMC